MQAEEPTDPEHGDEPEQNGRRRHAAEIEPEMNRVQDAAEQIVKDERQQEKPAADHQATAKYQISRAQFNCTATAS